VKLFTLGEEGGCLMVFEICVILLLIVLGVLQLNGKGTFLISGYNTKSYEEQEKYNITALSKFMGKMMFLLAFSMVFWVFSDLFKLHFLFIVGMVLFVCIILFMLIYMNTNNRFKK